MAHRSTPIPDHGHGESKDTDLVPIGEGYSTRVLRSREGRIIRAPKYQAAADRQARLARCLPLFAAYLPVSIPVPRSMFPASTAFPFGAIAYDEIPGVTMPATLPSSSPLARALGSFLASLHAISPDQLGVEAGLIPNRDKVDADCDAVMTIALPYLRETQPSLIHTRLLHWWEAYRSARQRANFVPSLIHGDFWYENILVDTGHKQVLGVLDWVRMAFDDPAQDFATLLHSGDMFCSHVLNAYRDQGGHVDNDLMMRRQRHWEFREFTGLAMAIDARDNGEVTAAMRKLKHGPLRHLFLARL